MINKYIIKEFKHELSRHCESSALRDLISYEGIPITEEMTFGLDSTFGFTFMNNATGESSDDSFNMNFPFFLGGKQGTITKDSLVCRILGLNITMNTFSSADVAWESSKKLIIKDIPVGIQLDLAFLPYMEEEEDIHFGGHWVALVGYDEDKGVALVSETDRADIQEVPIDQLKKGRSSKFGSKFMHPQNKQITIKRRPDGKKPPFARAVKIALQEVSRQIVAPSINFHGIPAMRLFVKSIPTWPDILQGQLKFSGEMVPKAYLSLDILHGLIETWGTGGSAFRNLYAGFLKELLQHPEINEGPHAWNEEEMFHLDVGGENLSKSAKLWGDFSSHLRTGLDKDKENCLDNLDLKYLEDLINEIIILEKDCFENVLKIKL